MAEIVPSVKNQDEGTRWEFWKCLMNKKKKKAIVFFSKMERTNRQKVQ